MLVKAQKDEKDRDLYYTLVLAFVWICSIGGSREARSQIARSRKVKYRSVRMDV